VDCEYQLSPKLRSELLIPYDPIEKKLYALGEPSCRYYQIRWNPLPINAASKLKISSARPGPDYWKHFLGGRASHGEFPVVFVREYFRWLGYTVLASEPRLARPNTNPPEPEGYVLLSYPGARDPKHCHHHNYQRMADIFGEAKIEKLNETADKKIIQLKRNRGGGDPDLFVFKGDGKKECFFVEVKEADNLLDVQKLCFSLIEKHLECEVKICRIVTL
jgi:hypothetical protein